MEDVKWNEGKAESKWTIIKITEREYVLDDFLNENYCENCKNGGKSPSDYNSKEFKLVNACWNCKIKIELSRPTKFEKKN